MKTKVSAANPFRKDRYLFLWEVLRNHKPGRHLDYGAYNGEILNVLAKTEVITDGIGVDLNLGVVEEHRLAMNKNVELRYIEKGAKLPFDDDSFDSISMLDVLEHIHDQESILKELNRVLRAGGKLIITVPKTHVWSFLDVGNFKFRFPRLHKLYVSWRYSKAYFDERYATNVNGLYGDVEKEKMWHQHFKPVELESLLRNCGFDEFEFDGAGLFQRPLSILGLLLPFAKPFFSKLAVKDAIFFEQSNLFSVAIRSLPDDCGAGLASTYD
jgi:SAM-dependent methyltransferase